MRIWDVSPGYLNAQSLLGEHRELHGLHSILVHGKTGYSRHPETRRWVGCLSGLARRHALLLAEMQLRGYSHRSPLDARHRRVRWPRVFVTDPGGQYALLASKYRGKRAGRIPLPRTVQELWAHHRYSVLARDPGACRTIARRVARLKGGADLRPLAQDLVIVLRQDPPFGSVMNALERMWGDVVDAATHEDVRVARASVSGLLLKTRELALRVGEPSVITSTALADIALFVRAEDFTDRGRAFDVVI